MTDRSADTLHRLCDAMLTAPCRPAQAGVVGEAQRVALIAPADALVKLALKVRLAATAGQRARLVARLLTGRPADESPTVTGPYPPAALEALAKAWVDNAFGARDLSPRYRAVVEGLCGFGVLPATESQRMVCAMAQAAFFCAPKTLSVTAHKVWLARLCDVQACLASLVMARATGDDCARALAAIVVAWPAAGGAPWDMRIMMERPQWRQLAAALVETAPKWTLHWRPDWPALSQGLEDDKRGGLPCSIPVPVEVLGVSDKKQWPRVDVELPVSWPRREALAHEIAHAEVERGLRWHAALWHQLHQVVTCHGTQLRSNHPLWDVAGVLEARWRSRAGPAAVDEDGRNDPHRQRRRFRGQLALWSREQPGPARSHAILMRQYLGGAAMPAGLRDRLMRAWMEAFEQATGPAQHRRLQAMLRELLSETDPAMVLDLPSYRGALLPSLDEAHRTGAPRALPKVGAAGVLAAVAASGTRGLEGTFDGIQVNLAALVRPLDNPRARQECQVDTAACCAEVLARCAEMGEDEGRRARAALLASVCRQATDSPALPGALAAIRTWAWGETATADALPRLLALVTSNDAAARDLLPELLGAPAGDQAWGRILRASADLPTASLVRLLGRLDDPYRLAGARRSCGLTGFELERLALAWAAAAPERVARLPLPGQGIPDPLEDVRNDLGALSDPRRLKAWNDATTATGRFDDLRSLLELLLGQHGTITQLLAGIGVNGLAALLPPAPEADTSR